MVREPPPPPPLPTFAFPFADPEGSWPAHSTVRFGPDLDDNAFAKLLGHVSSKRILDLGCGFGGNAIALALAGAHVVAVDESPERLAVARAAADEAEVRIEFHHADPADLAFIRGDRIDSCIAVYSVAAVDDVARVFRQVHRVLKPDGPFVVSLPHPLALATDDDERPRMVRPLNDPTPLTWSDDTTSLTVHPHGIETIVASLRSSNFRLDQLLEPACPPAPHPSRYWSPARSTVPPTIIFRCRKDRS